MQAAKEVIAASQAETGNHGYELVQSTENETVFYMLEKWADMDAIQQHNESEHFKNFRTPLLILLQNHLKFQF